MFLLYSADDDEVDSRDSATLRLSLSTDHPDAELKTDETTLAEPLSDSVVEQYLTDHLLPSCKLIRSKLQPYSITEHGRTPRFF